MRKGKVKIVMKTKLEIKKWLLENCVSKNGDLDLSGLDFSNFEGDLIISNMKVKNTLFQSHHEIGKALFQDDQHVGENLYQSDHCVGGNLYQGRQQVLGSLAQHSQIVKGDLYSHKLEKDELWGDTAYNYVFRIKALKPITKEELAKMGYELKEGGVKCLLRKIIVHCKSRFLKN